ncbi:hypothetical protein KKG71_01085 [Patescibacteria group bacterium]|nr:hypothetical protein [Patescibacteria group bacterium]
MKNFKEDILVLIFGVAIPAYLPYLLEDKYSDKFIFNLRIITLLVILISAIYLLVVNLKTKKDKKSPLVVIISIGIILYFGYTLLISLVFSNFTGF